MAGLAHHACSFTLYLLELLTARNSYEYRLCQTKFRIQFVTNSKAWHLRDTTVSSPIFSTRCTRLAASIFPVSGDNSKYANMSSLAKWNKWAVAFFSGIWTTRQCENATGSCFMENKTFCHLIPTWSLLFKSSRPESLGSISDKDVWLQSWHISLTSSGLMPEASRLCSRVRLAQRVSRRKLIAESFMVSLIVSQASRKILACNRSA